MLEPQIESLEQAIWRVARRAFGPRAERRGQIAESILELSRRYNLEEKAPQGDLLARLVFFTVADLAKAVFPLAELLARGALPTPVGEPLRVLDVGAGCGAMTLGLLALLDDAAVAVDAIDRDADALALMQQVLVEARPAVQLRLQPHELAGALPREGASYDLILAGSLLAELDGARRLPLVRALLARLRPNGALLLLEPALRRTTRDLHQLRDELLAAGEAHVFAPCTHGGPCPALLRPGDWCHESRVWHPPPEARRLVTATRLRRRDLTWSYVTLNRHGASIGGTRAGVWRVVSELLEPKGKHEIFLCDGARRRATLLRRHRSPSNEAFRRLDRGRLVWLRGAAERGDELRLDAESEVELEDPARSAVDR